MFRKGKNDSVESKEVFQTKGDREIEKSEAKKSQARGGGNEGEGATCWLKHICEL